MSPLVVQCIYEWSDENGDGKEGIEHTGGWESEEIE